MSLLFEPFRIGSLEITNRFIRSATTSAWSDKRGIIRAVIIDLYRRLAEGDVGLIVKGHLYVTDEGKAHEGMAGISSDIHVPKLKELTNIVHEHEGKIVAQINHAGYNSMVDPAGPSDYMGDGWNGRALEPDEIHDIVEAFGSAAERAMEAGFDGIQIHGAHGYLISQFLSKHVNKRDDDWGGAIENRMRLLNQVYDEIRAKVGGCTPVMIKINCDDFSPDGFTIEESTVVADKICKRGIDLIELSGGGFGRKEELRSRARSKDPELIEAAFAGYAENIRKITKPTPMALVNGIRSLNCMQAIVGNDLADIVSMSRPFIREPDLIKRLKAGQHMATCTTCNVCRDRDVFGKMMLRCHLD